MGHFNLISIGGDAAGMGAASQARRIDNSISIAVFEKTEFVSYAACGMPYMISNDVTDFRSLIAIDKDEFINKRKIAINTLTEVTEVDFDKKSLTVKNNDKAETHTWDKLIIATGASAARPPIPGIDNKGVFVLRTLRDGLDIKNFIVERKPDTVILIGGGFISLELSESFIKTGLKVILVEKMDSVASLMSPEIRDVITAELIDKGVQLVTSASISEIKKDGERLNLVTDKGVFNAPFIIVSTGARPNTGLFKNSPLKFHQSGAIVIDEYSRTNIPDVYAAGDCATVKNLITGVDDYMPMATTANKQGRVAGLQAAGVTTELFKGAIGTQMMKVCDLEAAKTGFNRNDASKHGIEIIDSITDWKSRAGYCPASRPIKVKLTIRADNRKVIGGEIIGSDFAAHRINTIAAAVTAGMTVEDLAYLDAGYAPPFSPVWDPVIAAAQGFISRVKG
ncbi:MAG TPA: FAD-dependent oxidoreductase [Spirochaetota bacterium]|mgnify:CR=1 FL=1|nr:FAD-dependent oxidoreductase [Spirochaetota bacterium]